jgi:hypothetical protein
MTRRYAWSDVGTRAIGHAPNGHWKTTTFLAGLTCEGLIAPFVLDGPINAECFLAYVEQILLPVLRVGDTVILDNCRATRTKTRRALSRAPAHACCSCRPTAQISIRSRWPSKFKGLLRQAQARTVEALWDFIGRTLNLLTPEECTNYVRHCGYNPL